MTVLHATPSIFNTIHFVIEVTELLFFRINFIYFLLKSWLRDLLNYVVTKK